ncbi:MAG: hypothetical protein U0X73_02915 [Thermoanaerobaculia bacterium]
MIPIRRFWLGLVSLLVGSLLVFAAAAAAAADDGDLDPLFGPSLSGIAHVGFDLGGTLADYAIATAVANDGAIVLAGSAVTGALPDSLNSAVTRLFPDGNVDPGFGSFGRLTFDTDFAGSQDQLSAVGFLSTGEIVAAGTTGGNGASVVKLSANGIVEDQRVFHFAGQSGFLALAVAPGDKILLAGYINRGTNYAFLVMRLLPDLGRDSSFAGTGETEIDFDLGAPVYDDDVATAVTLDHAGRVVVCGYANFAAQDDDMAVARLLANGQLDIGFSGDGRATSFYDLGPNEKSDQCHGVAVDKGNAVYLAGTVKRDASPFQFAAVTRLFSTGNPDTNFGNFGLGRDVLSAVASDIDAGGAIAVQSDGILAIGQGEGLTGKLGAARLTPAGFLDGSFGGGTGAVSYNVFFNGAADRGAALALQGGRIVLAGSGDVNGGGDRDFAAIRLQAALIFADDFELGDSSAWTTQAP